MTVSPIDDQTSVSFPFLMRVSFPADVSHRNPPQINISKAIEPVTPSIAWMMRPMTARMFVVPSGFVNVAAYSSCGAVISTSATRP